MQVANEVVPAALVRRLDGAGGEPPAVLQVKNMNMNMAASSVYEKVSMLVSGNAVVMFTISGCCMCHVVKQLLLGLGVGPTVVELDRDPAGADIHALLFHLSSGGGRGGRRPPRQAHVVPAVFVGGKFLGGIEAVMACHINGSLVPLLKDAGALWL